MKKLKLKETKFKKKKKSEKIRSLRNVDFPRSLKKTKPLFSQHQTHTHNL